MSFPRATHTFTTLEIPGVAYEQIRMAIARAGEEYVKRYVVTESHEDERIYFGGEVSLKKGDT